jgi:hypothetical protein
LLVAQNKSVHNTQGCPQKAALNHASTDLRIPRVHTT